MKTINIGGVPEHFNLAWYLGLKNKEYKDVGINLRWKKTLLPVTKVK